MADLFDSDNSPKTEPDKIIIGDLTQWRRVDLSDYDNTLYTLKYSARLATTAATEIEITAAADGATNYLVSEASATTAAYTAGIYYWQAYITRDSDSERIKIDAGQWEAVANHDANTGDPRSHAKIMLDKIESLLEGRADADVENYAIGSRSITKMSVEELQKWRSHYRSEYDAELDEIARDRGKPTSNIIQARFVS